MTNNMIDLRARLTLLLEEDEKPQKKPVKKTAKKAPPKATRKTSPRPKLEDPKSQGEVAPKPKKPPQPQTPPTPAPPKPINLDVDGFLSNRDDLAGTDFYQHALNLYRSDSSIADGYGIGGGGPPGNDDVPLLPPPTPDNLPAVISTAVARTDYDGVPKGWQPKFKQVRESPAFFLNVVQATGREVFGPFTDIPIENINYMAHSRFADLGSTNTEVDMMANWIRRHGVRDDQAELEFMRGPMAGYAPNTTIWNTDGYTFMLVKDQAGNYIYAWPGGRGVHLGGNNVPKLESKISTRALVRHLIEGAPGPLPATLPAPAAPATTMPKPGPMAGAAAKLNHLIYELHPLIDHLPSFETIERHLLNLVANKASTPSNYGQSDAHWRKQSRERDAAGEAAANARSTKALHIIRGYIRLRKELDARGTDKLKAHMDAVAYLRKSGKFDPQYIDAIFNV